MNQSLKVDLIQIFLLLSLLKYEFWFFDIPMPDA